MFSPISVSTVSISRRGGLGKGISVARPDSGVKAVGTDCPQPCQRGPNAVISSGEPKHLTQRVSTSENGKLLDALFNGGLNQ